mmetsp:Transcript_7254/g.30131  ORF Transcript_7254/g.30131 Transcript_7254/m.30131 type:complete len:267 (-) Transcript_7254:2224-3024(-)
MDEKVHHAWWSRRRREIVADFGAFGVFAGRAFKRARLLESFLDTHEQGDRFKRRTATRRAREVDFREEFFQRHRHRFVARRAQQDAESPFGFFVRSRTLRVAATVDERAKRRRDEAGLAAPRGTLHQMQPTRRRRRTRRRDRRVEQLVVVFFFVVVVVVVFVLVHRPALPDRGGGDVVHLLHLRPDLLEVLVRAVDALHEQARRPDDLLHLAVEPHQLDGRVLRVGNPLVPRLDVVQALGADVIQRQSFVVALLPHGSVRGRVPRN